MVKELQNTTRGPMSSPLFNLRQIIMQDIRHRAHVADSGHALFDLLEVVSFHLIHRRQKAQRIESRFAGQGYMTMRVN